MHTITGEAATANAARIMRRLCRHWSHKYPVEFDEVSGVIQLPDVRVTMQAVADRLLVSLENPVADVPQRMTGVVSEHLQRMAGAEENLVVNWVQ